MTKRSTCCPLKNALPRDFVKKPPLTLEKNYKKSWTDLNSMMGFREFAPVCVNPFL